MMTQYLSGFGNHFSTEVIAGCLPIGRNSPQKTSFGLYAEQWSGTAFTAPRAENHRSWLYRLRPSAAHPPYQRYMSQGHLRSAPFDENPPSPNRLRWDPLSIPKENIDFVDGLHTVAGNDGCAIHLYIASQSMKDRVFGNADGDMLIVPQQGAIRIVTELGILELSPLHIALIPRGLKFRVELLEPVSRGYICENYGASFRLPDLGPIGSNGLANARDFEAPIAYFEDREQPTEVIQKFGGSLWHNVINHSPIDVVAWHGNLTPYRYDLTRFNAINSVSFDHPDPSIFTVLTSPSETIGTANIDFVIFPPRWMVAEDTFRPPWFHRNVMSEYMGLIMGEYDAKSGGFLPGGGSLHNSMSAHGADVFSYERAIEAPQIPQKIEGSMAFMFESRHIFKTTKWAMETSSLQSQYDDCWDGFRKAQLPAVGGPKL